MLLSRLRLSPTLSRLSASLNNSIKNKKNIQQAGLFNLNTGFESHFATSFPANNMSKPVLYSYFRSSCSYRVRIALNLKNIPFETKPISLIKDGGEQHSEAFKQLNPMEFVPALIIDGNTLIESLNIMNYLDETRPQNPLFPSGPINRARVREICEIIASGIQPLQNMGILQFMGDDKKLEWAQKVINKGFTAVEKLLKERSGKYCYGDSITMADCCLIPQVYNARRFKVDMEAYPNIVRIEKELENHPAFKAAHPDNQPDSPPSK